MAQQLEQRQGEEPKDASELMPESEAGQEDLGYSALPSDAYEEEEWETQKQKVWPHQIHVFGMRQNQINRRYSAWIRTLEIQNRALEIRVQRLEEELAEQKKELEDQKKELTALFDEFENYRTPESKFAHSLDNLQPLLLNNSNGGGDWREHQVTSEQVYGRQRKTQLGSETLYKVTDQILKENIEKGNIKES